MTMALGQMSLIAGVFVILLGFFMTPLYSSVSVNTSVGGATISDIPEEMAYSLGAGIVLMLFGVFLHYEREMKENVRRINVYV